MSQIERFNFHGDELSLVRQGADLFVVVKRVCESLAIDESGQRQKLKSKAWAVTELISATGPDGKIYQSFAIHLDSLPMWLATIEPSRVSEAIRPKLERYQLECARVLRDHFLGTRAESSVAAKLEGVVDALGRLVAGFTSMVNTRLDNLEARISAAGNEHPHGGIGRSKMREAITGRICVAAARVAGERKGTAYLSERGRLLARLRKRIRWPNRLEFLPASKLGEAHAEVDSIEREVEALVRGRNEARSATAKASQGSLFEKTAN
jgi:hypothetical protein